MTGGTLRRAVVVAAAAVGLSAAGCLHGGHGHHQPVVMVPPPGAVPRELDMVTMPEYVIAPPDVLLIEGSIVTPEGDPAAAREKDPATGKPRGDVGGSITTLFTQDVSGQFTVRPDGTVYLGYFGSVNVAGYTLGQAAAAVRDQIVRTLNATGESTKVKPETVFIKLDVTQYNTKKYYLIFDGAGNGEQVLPVPFTGSDTVLDALGYANGLPAVASKRNIWVARRTPHAGQHEQILPVDWVGITQHGHTATNYQLFPGDRVYVKAQKLVAVDIALGKLLRPVEQVFGITLLGTSTVNTISGRGIGAGNNFGN